MLEGPLFFSTALFLCQSHRKGRALKHNTACTKSGDPEPYLCNMDSAFVLGVVSFLVAFKIRREQIVADTLRGSCSIRFMPFGVLLQAGRKRPRAKGKK